MKKHCFILGIALLSLFLGILTPQFAQDTSTGSEKSDDEARARAAGLLRTINTAEVGEFETYGSYSSWETLLTHESKHWIEECLASLYPQELGPHPDLSEVLPKILPGWTLRLNARADGQGYDAMLDAPEAKQQWFALYTNEKGVIWKAAPLQ